MRIILLILLAFSISGCTIHERDYEEEIPIPIVKDDTINVSDWDK